MVTVASTGAWHYAHLGTNSWSVDNHGDRKYTFVFGDGHSKLIKIIPTEGLTSSSDKLTFLNK